MIDQNKIVIGLSGGMDSVTLLALLLNQGKIVYCCTFFYGSKHNEYEMEAIGNVIEYYKKLYPGQIKQYIFDLSDSFSHFESNLLKGGGEIPEGHFEDEIMKVTVVPGRNLIFASMMAGLAESIGAAAVALGVHGGDHAIYPDCRAEFIDSLKDTVYLSTDKKVGVYAPFLHIDKVGIIEIGYSKKLQQPVPYQLTRTCYKDQSEACGKCGSCQERQEAFTNLGLKDPIHYQKI